MHWRWRDFDPFTARAAAEVPIEDVERRAMIFVNPAFGGQTMTTANLLAAVTVLEPGDHAVPHRHTAAAIRFATFGVVALSASLLSDLSLGNVNVPLLLGVVIGWRWLDPSAPKKLLAKSARWGLLLNVSERELLEWREH